MEVFNVTFKDYNKKESARKRVFSEKENWDYANLVK